MTSYDAHFYDDWYAHMAESSRRDDLVREALGLPPQLQATGLLPWSGITDIVDGLSVGPDATVVDLGCGRGDYGMEVARRTRARLIGVDFSAVAIAQARSQISAAGLAGRAEFRVADLTTTGLRDASVHGVMSIDAIQFATPPAAALSECRRILIPGGRLVLTWWEARDRDDQRIPERMRELDLQRDLVTTGFIDVAVVERPDWHAAERLLWEAAAAAPLTTHDDALRALQDEAARVLPIHTSMRRLFGHATAPQPADRRHV